MTAAHAPWCDRFHVVVGTSECSAQYQLDGHHEVLRYGDASGEVDDILVTCDGVMCPR